MLIIFKSHASSIFLLTEKALDRNLLLAKILNQLILEIRAWESGQDLTDSYRQVSATIGKAVRIELPGGESIEAIAQDIDSTGALHLDSGQIITVGDVIHLDSKLSE